MPFSPRLTKRPSEFGRVLSFQISSTEVTWTENRGRTTIRSQLSAEGEKNGIICLDPAN